MYDRGESSKGLTFLVYHVLYLKRNFVLKQFSGSC